MSNTFCLCVNLIHFANVSLYIEILNTPTQEIIFILNFPASAISKVITINLLVVEKSLKLKLPFELLR